MIPWFRFNRAPWGTVYVMQCRRDDRLFKVGFTTRRTKDRRTELNRVAGDDMKIVSAVTLPWARSCETSVLRRLRRNPFRRRDRRGTEWFRLRKNEDIARITALVDRTAKRIAWVAKLKLSWPRQVKIRTFNASRG